MRRLAQTEIRWLPVQRLVVIGIVDESVERWIERIHIIHIGLLRHFSARQVNCRINNKTTKIFVNKIYRRACCRTERMTFFAIRSFVCVKPRQSLHWIISIIIRQRL